MDNDAPISKLSEGDWDSLVSRIKMGHCTPFLGAGISAGVIPTGSQIAEKLAKDRRFEYPLADVHDLIKVSQYIALTVDASRPKELISEIINNSGYPKFDDPDEPHAVLANLPLPLYITTDYDDFMYRALEKTGVKRPKLFVNRWNDFSKPETDVADELVAPDINPTKENPAVYHFHGHKDQLHTMVLTEDDYLDFLVRVSRDPTLIPPRIQHALAGTMLLFIGYSLNDTNFRVIFRGLIESIQKNIRKTSVTVQVAPDQPKVVKYLTKYFDAAGIRVYWGTARDFVHELKQRWDNAR